MMTHNTWEKLFIYLRWEKENSSNGFHFFMPINIFTFEQHGSWERRGKKEKKQEKNIFYNLGDAPRTRTWEYVSFHLHSHKSEKQGWGSMKNLAQDVMCFCLWQTTWNLQILAVQLWRHLPVPSNSSDVWLLHYSKIQSYFHEGVSPCRLRIW